MWFVTGVTILVLDVTYRAVVLDKDFASVYKYAKLSSKSIEFCLLQTCTRHNWKSIKNCFASELILQPFLQEKAASYILSKKSEHKKRTGDAV